MNTELMQELARHSHKTLCEYLEEKGNNLSCGHREALKALTCTMSGYVAGTIIGRKAFPLATGLGKTSAVKAWIKSMHELDISGSGIAVAAGKVEALCEMKRDLMEMGVPASKIGILHSYDFNPKKLKEGKEGYASMPSTDINHADKQFMLVTHQRIKSCPQSLELFNTYQGKPRELLLWDESLVSSEPVSVTTNYLKAETAYLESLWSNTGDTVKTKVISYLNECNAMIDRELHRKEQTDDFSCIRLPVTSPEFIVDAMQSIAPIRKDFDNVEKLLKISSEQLRVTRLGQGGVINYQVSVPKELENILILDASYPVRELIKLDVTISDIGKEFTLGTDCTLDKIKKFSKVNIHHMKAGGGRSSIEKAFGDTKVINDIVKVIVATPEDEKVLVFVYKKKSVDMKQKLLKALIKTKVNTNRVSILTWGNETSSNDYADHNHVVLAGILQQSHQQLEASYVGQVDDLHTRVNYRHIKSLALSESTHLAYQAGSRGHCRIVDNGEAGEMNLWLIHYDSDIKDELLKVMPEAEWSEWEGDYSKARESSVNVIVGKMQVYLKGLSEDNSRISSRKLKDSLGGHNYPSSTWSRAFKKLGTNSDWMIEGRSLVRASEVFS